MSTKVVVELTPDEDKVLNAFRRVQASDEKLRQSVKATGDVGGAAAKQLADAFIKGGKDSTASIGKLIAELKRTGDAGRSVGSELDKHLADIGAGGRRSIETIIESIARLQPEAATQARMMLAEFEKTQQGLRFDKAVASLSKLGGEFQLLGAEISKATNQPLADAQKRAGEIVEELRAIDPTKAEAIAAAMDRASKAIESAKVDELVGSLSAGSEESRKLANALGKGTREAALEAAGGVDAIADKIVALRPELSAFVDQWRADMAEAAKFGEGQYEKVLNALRAGGPVSKQVADQIRKNLVDAGKIGERSFDDMIKPLEKIDPAMAEQAKKLHKQFEDVEKNGKGAFGSIAKFATSELSQIVVAYVGVQEAIQFVTDAITEQQQVLDDAAAGHRTLAKAQAEAFKNLAGFSDEVQDQLITKFAFDIAEKARISDLPAIVDAIGSTASAGANIEQLKSAVQTSALLNRLSPENIAETSGSLIDFAKATGNNDAAQNASQMFLLASQSRVTDPSKVFRNAAPVLVAGANMAPEGQQESVALTGAAVFAALTKAGADVQGDSSSTAAIQFMARMDEFFSSLGEDATKAREELDKLKLGDPLSATQRTEMERLSNNEANRNRTQEEIRTLEAAIGKEQAFQDGADKFTPKEDLRQSAIRERQLREQLSEKEKAAFSDRDAARLEDLRSKVGQANQEFQAKVAALEGKIAAGQVQGFDGRSPETPIEQFKAFQANPALQQAFLANPFGEQRFRPGFQQLVTGGQAFDDMMSTQQLLSENQGSTALFDRTVEQSQSRTPQMQMDFAASAAETGKAIRDATDTLAGSLGQVREIVASALEDTRASGMTGIMQSFDSMGVRSGSMMGSDFATELVEGIQLLFSRRESIAGDGIADDEVAKVRRIDTSIGALLDQLDSDATEQISQRTIELAQARARNAGQNRINFAPNEESRQSAEAVFGRIEQILQNVLDVQTQAAEATKQTAKNTQAQRPPLAAAQRAAATAPPVNQGGQP